MRRVIFDMQPVLRGERVVLRPTVAADREPLYAVASDPEIWAQHPVRDRWRREVFDPFFDEALACGGGVTIVDAETGEVIGASRYYHLDPAAQTVTIGYTYLARSRWGGGVNAEAKKLMLDHAFGHRGVRAVRLYVGHDNHRSRRAIEKLGAVLISDDWPSEPGKYIYEVPAPQPLADVIALPFGELGVASGPDIDTETDSDFTAA